MSDFRVNNNNMYDQMNDLSVERHKEFEKAREAQGKQAVQQPTLTQLGPLQDEDPVSSHLDSLPAPAQDCSVNNLPTDMNMDPTADLLLVMNRVTEDVFKTNKDMKRTLNEAELKASQESFKQQTESIKEKRAGIALRCGLKIGGALLALGMDAKGFKAAAGSATVEGNQTTGQSWNQAGGSTEGAIDGIADANQQSHDANAAEDDQMSDKMQKLQQTMRDGGQELADAIQKLVQQAQEVASKDYETRQKLNSV
ncbi:MAG: hypothetical protein AAFS03_07570 [Pseudomonadota bacterium]